MTPPFDLDFSSADLPAQTVIVGFPGPGMAAVAANQFLIERLDLEESGHIRAEGLPSITPYRGGRPHHPTRMFSSQSQSLTLLTSELPIPVQHSEPFGRVLLEWIDSRDVEEVTLLTSLPFLETDQDVHYVASDDYVDHRLAGTDIPPLQDGFLTGVNSSLIDRAIDTALRVGVLASPVHPYLPIDPEASLNLVRAVNELYGLEVDTTALQEFASRTRRHYEQLASQVEQSHTHARDHEDYGFM